MSNEIIELISIDQAVTWNSWAVQYFFFIGISVGAALLSTPAFVFGRQGWEQFGRVALLVALTTGLVAPVALVSDLHQPARFFQFYLHFTPDSWMSWGAFFLPAYLGALALFSWLVFSNSQAIGTGAVRVIGVATGVFALLIALYTGSEMGVLESRALWESQWLVPLYLVSGLSGAAGLCMVLTKMFYPEQMALNRLASFVLNVTLFMVIGVTALWLGMGVAGHSTSGAILAELAVGYGQFEIVVLWLIVGTFLPLVITFVELPSLAVITGACAIFGAWMARWVIFIGGQELPKNGAGFYNFELPLGAEGWLGILGSFGFWLLLVILITTMLPWQRSDQSV